MYFSLRVATVCGFLPSTNTFLLKMVKCQEANQIVQKSRIAALEEPGLFLN